MSTAHKNVDQYHHFVPRFILRRFIVPSSSSEAPQTRKYGKKPRRIHSEEQEQIHFFNLSTCQLEIQPIAKVYGAKNLYRDVKNPDNANHLEEMLSQLESRAASIVKQIHDAVTGQVKVNRESLEKLRKFLFIMFYRKAALSESYYDDTNPENAPIAAWLKRVKKTNGLQSQADVWIHFLEYFLSTPHQEIMSRAINAQKKHGIMNMVFGHAGLPEEAMDDYPAIDYTSLCGAFFMGIVEAADGTEFVLSDSSFGLWEGLVMGMPNIHRLFVVSPRIALVLRSNMCRVGHGLSLFPIDSAFIKIPIEPPQAEYAGGRQFLEDREIMDSKYRLSARAQKDLYHFRIVKLTKVQTEEVNKVVLINARKDGSITFLTKEIMLDTLRTVMKEPAEVQLKIKLKILMEKLDDSHKNLDPLVAAITSSLDRLRLSTESRTLKAKTKMKTKSETKTTALNNDTVYDRAYLQYADASIDEPGGKYIFDTTDYLVEQFRNLELPGSLLENMNLETKGRTRTDPFAALAETLQEIESELVMGTMKEVLECFDEKKVKRSNPGLYEAAIVGLLDWLVKNKGDVVKLLFPDVALVKSK